MRNYNSSKPDNEIMPYLSSQFFMVLEGKGKHNLSTLSLFLLLFSFSSHNILVETNAVIIDKRDTFYDRFAQLEWFYDSVTKQERVDSLIEGAPSATYEYASLFIIINNICSFIEFIFAVTSQANHIPCLALMDFAWRVILPTRVFIH